MNKLQTSNGDLLKEVGECLKCLGQIKVNKPQSGAWRCHSRAAR